MYIRGEEEQHQESLKGKKNVEFLKGNLHSTNRARTMERLEIRPGVWT